MLKLKQPNYPYDHTLALCCNGITGNKELLQKVNDGATDLKAGADVYEVSASTGELYTIKPLQNQDEDDPEIIKKLKKSDMIKLYSNYFAGKGKPARIVYDALMVAADDKCPFCGGIGRPRNLDHFLPKAHFPQFSIVPINLVPSCRDCNMDGKGESVATTEAEQLIHPYLDDNRFFNEQWISARYVSGRNNEPGVVEYFVSPPEHWKDAHKKRVINHFNDFDLALRYSKEAGPRSALLLAQFQALVNLPVEKNTAKEIIFQTIIDNSPFVNHWERVMCIAMMSEL
ncbi:MAG: HNH endonuclease [Citrobacter sp.]|uniref:HNH endonuclease n=1 Tax=Citrobacter sp. TaxID=1896336 RepID=UPI0015E99CDD|nr:MULTISPECIES: HNH endonuclease signature motif containing protein [Citrobacter]MBS6003063.1 HNH endonuclease [Citrobacter sp.]QLS06442.1 HNH endonuclease [Citrobacter freundii]